MAPAPATTLHAHAAHRPREHLRFGDRDHCHGNPDRQAINIDLLEDIGGDDVSLEMIMAEIHTNRHSVEALSRVTTLPSGVAPTCATVRSPNSVSDQALRRPSWMLWKRPSCSG